MDDQVRKPELVTFGAEAFTSQEYARAEPDRLWRKVWQHACREEDIPNVGDYVTYDIADDTILVVRSAPITRPQRSSGGSLFRTPCQPASI